MKSLRISRIIKVRVKLLIKRRHTVGSTVFPTTTSRLSDYLLKIKLSTTDLSTFSLFGLFVKTCVSIQGGGSEGISSRVVPLADRAYIITL